MKRNVGAWVAALAIAFSSAVTAVKADDLFGGMYAHAFLEAHGREDDSFDTMIGYRTSRLNFLSWIGAPEVHAILSVNDRYSTDFAAVGLDWRIRFSERWYFRPGLGIAYTTGKADIPPVNTPGLTPAEIAARTHVYDTRIDFGDHVLFEPELALGYNFSPKWSLEGSYVHLSNGQILHQGKNQGVDDAGLRLNYHFR